MTAAWKSLESTCRNYKKTFLHTQEHVYVGCCSYKCFRVSQRKENEEREQKRGERLYLVTEKATLKRIELCKERIERYKTQSMDKTQDKKTRDSARRMKNEWVRRLTEANETLNILRSWNDGENDGI